jgi:rare lipoprotein A
MHNLLPWRQRAELASLASSVMVVSTHSSEQVEDKQTSKGQRVKRGFWQYSQRLANWTVGGATSTKKEQFQVWVKEYLIAHFPNQHQANIMAQRLKRFLSDRSDPYLNASPIEPTVLGGVPGVKVGDRLLFKIDDVLAKALGRNQELLAIEWANNLRIALGKQPLKLAEAQKRIYNLVETSTTFEGLASWYGPYFHGRMTATGETYNQHELTAAHPSLPFDTYLKVRNLENGNSVIVRINDRGPFVADRTLDLSLEAARCINSEKVGVVPFEAVIMQPPSPQYTVIN